MKNKCFRIWKLIIYGDVDNDVGINDEQTELKVCQVGFYAKHSDAVDAAMHVESIVNNGSTEDDKVSFTEGLDYKIVPIYVIGDKPFCEKALPKTDHLPAIGTSEDVEI